MKNTIIRNIGAIATGNLSNPLAEGDTICIKDDRIAYIGNASGAPTEEYTVEIDANGLTACPGLIDAHAHPPMDNYLNRYKAYDWVENYAGAGITSLVSVGGIRFPGAAADKESAITQALCARSVWSAYHPVGSKIHADSVMLFDGMTDEDFKYLKEKGISVVGELGMSPVQDPEKVRSMTEMAQKNGLLVTAHCGAPSYHGCASYSAEQLRSIRPDVICHVNGAPTPLPEEEVKALVQSGEFWFDTVSNGSETLFAKIVQWALEAGTINKMMVGTNMPSMSGFSPMGLWIQMVVASHMTDLKAEEAIALATGNVAKCYGLDHGTLEVGAVADMLLCDSGSVAPGLLGTLKYGRVPSVGPVITNGVLRLEKGKNTAPVKHKPQITVKA